MHFIIKNQMRSFPKKYIQNLLSLRKQKKTPQMLRNWQEKREEVEAGVIHLVVMTVTVITAIENVRASEKLS